jgi:hypothetical protein
MNRKCIMPAMRGKLRNVGAGREVSTRRFLWTAASACVLVAGLAVASRARPVSRSLNFRDNFEQGKLDAWEFPFPEDWQILAEGPNHYLHMVRSRPPGVPRRPLQFALLKGPKGGSFTFQTSLRREHRSLIMVFNYVDAMHFYYAHFSVDTGTKQPVHNGIFIVNGEPRKRIAGLEAASALPTTDWHTARIARDVSSGLIEVFIDGSKTPLFSVKDRTFTCGRVGIGSFDETGDFDNVELRSSDAGCDASGLERPAAGK